MENTNHIKILNQIRRKALDLVIDDLPRGYKKELSIRAGVSYQTVLRFINGQDNEKLYKAFTEYIDDYVSETKALLKNAGIEMPKHQLDVEFNEIFDSLNHND
jgi:tRNA splicing ligase